jgi:guanylate kinase
MHKFRSNFIVLSAPSGGGKTTIAKMLVKKYNDLSISISATTRPKRPLEEEGRDYFFLNKDEFTENIKKDNFIEYEEVHGDYYGTLKQRVEELLAEGKAIIFDIDVKGAISIKKQYPEAILLFIKPPSLDELKARLKKRRSESEEAINKRLERINFEYEQAKHFDYEIINDHLPHTIKQIEDLILRAGKSNR